MKNFKKLIAVCLSTFVISGNVSAENALTTTDIKNEIASNLEVAIAKINQPKIETIAKVQLDQMTFQQNVEKFLVMAKYNEETTSVKVNIVAE